jgi:cell division septation protein DedD
VAALAVVVPLAVCAAASAAPSDAEKAWERGDRKAAGELVREYVERNPEAVRSAKVAALLARTAVDPEEAVSRWDEVIELEPAGALAAEGRFAKGLHAYSAGLYVAAAKEFDALAESYAKHFDAGKARLWKALAELGADDAAAAAASFERAHREGRDADTLAGAEIGAAHAAFRAGDVADALRRYERFEREHGSDGRASSAARRAAECLRLLGRTSEASALAARIERKYPNSMEATLARAEVRRIEAPREEPAPEEKRRGPFVVQVAALADLKNAVALRRDIRELGIDGVRIEMAEGTGEPLHRVLLGPYETEEEARAIADSVAALGNLNPRVREGTE